MNISEKSFYRGKNEVDPNRNVIRTEHGNVGQKRAYTPEIRESVHGFIMDIAKEHGHSLPNAMAKSNGAPLNQD